MNIIESLVTRITEENPYKLIELAGRTCYKSVPKEPGITSTNNFVRGLIKNGHSAMLEHSNIILRIPHTVFSALKEECDSSYLRFAKENNYYFVAGSLRAWRELLLKQDVSFFIIFFYGRYAAVFEDCKNAIYEENTWKNLMEDSSVYDSFTSRYEIVNQAYLEERNFSDELISTLITHTLRVVCDRGVSHEIVRHRNCAFAQESTRYCNYSLGKFQGNITVIKPNIQDEKAYRVWEDSCLESERAYLKLIELGISPEIARGVLPNDLKTELVITCSENEWKHILALRLRGITGKPHPNIEEVMKKALPHLIDMSNGRIN